VNFGIVSPGSFHGATVGTPAGTQEAGRPGGIWSTGAPVAVGLPVGEGTTAVDAADVTEVLGSARGPEADLLHEAAVAAVSAASRTVTMRRTGGRPGRGMQRSIDNTTALDPGFGPPVDEATLAWEQPTATHGFPVERWAQ
jgi:hypothetical protein